MSESNGQQDTFWSKARSWIMGLTAVLVVLPSLINGGIDVYKAALNIPRTKTERINMELFRKYFNKPPVTSLPVPIKSSMGTVEAKFSIFEEGDIFVEYGNFSQWFPLPRPETAKVTNVSFVSRAIAQENRSARGIGTYQQTDRFDGPILTRKRVYENGVIEQQRINSRSGQILEQTTTSPQTPDTNANHQLAPYGVIDLQTHKTRSPDNGPQATLCKTNQGECALVAPIQKGANCSCYTSYGTVPGIAQ